jgi:hypothetical protein
MILGRAAVFVLSISWLMPMVAAATVYDVSPGGKWFETLNGDHLRPGDEVVLAEGVYSDRRRLVIGHRGTAERPITIRAAKGARAILQRPDARQNSINIVGAQHLVLEGIEITGGSTGIRLMKSDAHACKFVTLESMHIHHVGGAAVTANNAGNAYEGLIFRRNHIHHTSGHGEGFYLGVNNAEDGSTPGRIFDCLIEGNYIHDLKGPSVSQGDGIEIKDGSYNNVIRDNVIHDTNYPGVIVYGTDGKAPNIVERNAIGNAGDHGIQAAADAIVRNNIVIHGKADGIHSHTHQSARVGNLKIIHNTVVMGESDGAGIHVSPTAERPLAGPVVIANNAIYAGRAGLALKLPKPMPGGRDLVIVGNLGIGGVHADGVTVGRGAFNPIGRLASDFDRWYYPLRRSTLVGAANSDFATADDFNGTSRAGTRDVGAYVFRATGNPGWRIGKEFKKTGTRVPAVVQRKRARSPRRNTMKRCLFAAIVLLAGPIATTFSARNPVTIPDVAKEDSICFALYTVQDGTLKMLAQLYPLADEDSRDVELRIERDGAWRTVAKEKVREDLYGSPAGAKVWNALFRVEDWDPGQDWNYRVVALDGVASYEGTIRKDPVDKEEIVVAAFTGNSNGDRSMKPDMIKNLKAQNPDLLFFSGDQSYDHRHHLGAWLLFGRQFGEVIKDRPTICIPDDHDVGQGNLWGEEGVQSHLGGGADGGYIMSPRYVNEVQFAQTANLPDPFDPTPIKRGITVYYTSLNVGGVDFAIIEDRKFKTGPAGVIPKMGPRPDHINDPKYDRKSVDVPEAQLLGERQLEFLRHWAQDWESAEMKAVLSQTIFCGGAHIHHGQRLLADLDSNGWPQSGRDRAIGEIRKAFGFMIAGDQHLASVIHHGIDEWGDAGFSFCVPSIVNYYPRMWLPLEKGVNPVSDVLEHTGSFLDGLGNHITMYAYANPNEQREKYGPKDKGAAGHGLIRFNKQDRTITIECWPRESDVTNPDHKQFPGWPVTVKQMQNYGRKPVGHLPALKVQGATDPVVQVIAESTGEIVYTLRIKGDKFEPPVFEQGTYTVKIGEGDKQKTFSKIKVHAAESADSINVDLR